MFFSCEFGGVVADHLTSFCQRRQGEIKYIRVSCIPIWSAAAVRQSSGSVRACEGMKGLGALEDCDQASHNPVICLSKAYHSSDLKTPVLSCRCLSYIFFIILFIHCFSLFCSGSWFSCEEEKVRGWSLS